MKEEIPEVKNADEVRAWAEKNLGAAGKLISKSKIIATADIGKVDVVVCGEKSFFDDDVWTTCAGCEKSICHRPYIPAKPRKLCFACLRKEVEKK